MDLLQRYREYGFALSDSGPESPPGAHAQARVPTSCGVSDKRPRLATLLRAAGSLFLFDRKAVRFFRKDGHNWQKKRDNKTVKETHEKLKARASLRSLRRSCAHAPRAHCPLHPQVGTVDALNWCAAAQQAAHVALMGPR